MTLLPTALRASSFLNVIHASSLPNSVYGIDYLNNDAAPSDKMAGGTFDLGAWFKNHGPDQTTPPLLQAIEGLKAKGITTFGATGYCKYQVQTLFSRF
jgi:hypothetical protein